ncbi:MAG: extracellular solute-binding protein [Clostridiales bacterium]|nr:extracellular solute-binding protein [Clostridiales bacterium]
MKRPLSLLLALVLCLALTACGQRNDENGTLKLYVDGAAYTNVSTMVTAFMEAYPNIQVEAEMLPQVELTISSDYTPSVDTDFLSQREAVLQQHRTALMAGSSDADLYLLTGGTSQFNELKGGALVQDVNSLMAGGVLADLSELLDKIDRSEYLNGVFEAGQLNGAQYLIPLRVELNGIIVDLSDDPVFPEGQEAFLQTLMKTYARELTGASLGCAFVVGTLSYPVVNKAKLTISLYDDNYTAALQWAQEFRALALEYPDEGKSYAELIDDGTLVMAATNPLLALTGLASALQQQDTMAELGYVTIPNEKDGVTAEVTAYAFVPATSENTQAAVTFLEWMLSQEVQGGSIPVFPIMGGGYPVRKGCAQAALEQSSFAYTLDYVEESAMTSLAECEERVTDGKYSTHYDIELLNTLYSWQAGETELDAALEALYNDWALYLDE